MHAMGFRDLLDPEDVPSCLMYLSISLQQEHPLNREHGRNSLIDKVSDCGIAILKHVPLTDPKPTDRAVVEAGYTAR